MKFTVVITFVLIIQALSSIAVETLEQEQKTANSEEAEATPKSAHEESKAESERSHTVPVEVINDVLTESELVKQANQENIAKAASKIDESEVKQSVDASAANYDEKKTSDEIESDNKTVDTKSTDDVAKEGTEDASERVVRDAPEKSADEVAEKTTHVSERETQTNKAENTEESLSVKDKVAEDSLDHLDTRTKEKEFDYGLMKAEDLEESVSEMNIEKELDYDLKEADVEDDASVKKVEEEYEKEFKKAEEFESIPKSATENSETESKCENCHKSGETFEDFDDADDRFSTTDDYLYNVGTRRMNPKIIDNKARSGYEADADEIGNVKFTEEDSPPDAVRSAQPVNLFGECAKNPPTLEEMQNYCVQISSMSNPKQYHPDQLFRSPIDSRRRFAPSSTLLSSFLLPWLNRPRLYIKSALPVQPPHFGYPAQETYIPKHKIVYPEFQQFTNIPKPNEYLKSFKFQPKDSYPYQPVTSTSERPFTPNPLHLNKPLSSSNLDQLFFKLAQAADSANPLGNFKQFPNMGQPQVSFGIPSYNNLNQ